MAGLAAARARGQAGGRPRRMTRAKLRTAMTMVADQANAAFDVAEQLGISVGTLHACVDGKGQANPVPAGCSAPPAADPVFSSRCPF